MLVFFEKPIVFNVNYFPIFAKAKETTMDKLRLSIFLLFLVFSFQGIAQNSTPIVRSAKTEMQGGEKFYIHIVKKGQTAYSISRAYNVKVTDIYKNNPGTEHGLKLDQELKIPFVVSSVAKKPLLKDSLSADKNFIYHAVAKGETLYRITKEFNVNQDILIKYNPNLTANLHPGDIIKIPTQDQLISEKAKLLYPKVNEYKVRKRDTYYRLHKKFEVSQAQLEQLNPKLKEEGLQKGMIILMPVGLKKLDTIPVYVDIIPDSVATQIDTSLVDSSFAMIDCDSLSARNDTFHIALMIPFYSNLESEIRSSNVHYSKGAKSYKSFKFIQFYEGFLLALDSIKQLGFHAEVYIYDTKGDAAETRKITQKPEFQSLDLVIGPLFHENVRIVLEAGKANNIKVVSPFSRNQVLVANNPHLFKVAPSTESIIENSCQWVADSLPNSRIIVIHDGTKSELHAVNLMKKAFARHASNGIDTNDIFVYSYKNADSKRAISNLSSNRNNLLINLSNNEAKISNFVRELSKKTKAYEIYLIGSELNWKRFKTLEVNYLVGLRLTQCTSHFVDPLDTAAQAFAIRFIDNYKTPPSAIAYNGFDISWYFMNALFYYGINFEACINKLDIHTMGTKFQFKQNGAGAYENTYLNMYQYIDYKLVNKKQR